MDNNKLTAALKGIIDKTGLNAVILIGFIGIILLSYDEITPHKKEKESAAFSADVYIENMENTMTQLLSSVQGAGQVKVMITLESGEENIYVMQEKSSQDIQSASGDISGQKSEKNTYENEIVLINSGDQKQALVEKTLQPTVQGVVVVCSGADDIKVVSDITNAVCVALDVTSNRVCVIKMK